MDALMNFGSGIFGGAWPAVWSLVKIVLIVAPLMLGVAYLTWAERKVIGYMQVRIGPNRVGPWGLIQPIADGLKLLLKEIIVPSGANKGVFIIAPMLAIAPALAAWAVVPFTDTLVLANIDASLLYIMAITSMGVYGIILSGWASNSKYAFLGAMRSAAQMVSYEIAMGFSLICVLMVSNSLNLVEIVNVRGDGLQIWAKIPDPALNPKDDSKIYASNVPGTIDGINKYPPGDIGSGFQPIAEQDYFALKYNRTSLGVGTGTIAIHNRPTEGEDYDGEVWTIEIGADSQTFYVRSSIRGTLPAGVVGDTYEITPAGQVSPVEFFTITQTSSDTAFEPGDAFILDTPANAVPSVRNIAPYFNTSSVINLGLS